MKCKMLLSLQFDDHLPGLYTCRMYDSKDQCKCSGSGSSDVKEISEQTIHISYQKNLSI